MNRWLLIPVILILAVSTAFSGYSYFQQNSKLDDALNELSALHDSISSFERDLIPLPGNTRPHCAAVGGDAGAERGQN